jgi:hypothetical protein
MGRFDALTQPAKPKEQDTTQTPHASPAPKPPEPSKNTQPQYLKDTSIQNPLTPSIQEVKDTRGQEAHELRNEIKRSKQARKEPRNSYQASKREKGAKKVKGREESGAKKEEQADTKRHWGMQYPLSVDDAKSPST